MKDILERLEHFLIPAYLLEDRHIAPTVRSLVLLSVIGAVLAVVYSLFWLLIMPERSERLILPLLIVGTTLLPLYLVRYQRIRLASHILTGGVWAMVTLTMLTSGGPRAPVFGMYIVVVLLAALLSGWWTATIYAGLTLVLSLLMTLADPAGVVFVPFATPLSAWLTQATGMIMIVAAAYAIVRRTQYTLQNTRSTLAELEKTRQELQASEERYRLISEVTSDFTFSTRASAAGDLEHTLLTGAIEDMLGYTPQAFLEHGGWHAVVHPDDLPVYEQGLALLRRNQRVAGELRVRRKDGAIRWIHVNAMPVWDAATDTLLGINGGVRDTTERKQAEDALRESERRYRELTANLPDSAVILFDHDLRFILIDGPEVTNAGYSSTAMVGKTLFEALPAEFAELAEPNMRAVLAGKRFSAELPFGDQLHCYNYVPLEDRQGNIRYGMIVALNITERKQAEDALREGERRYRMVSELISNYAYAYDIHPDGSFSPVWITDESFERMTGYRWQDIGATFQLYHPDDAAAAREHVRLTVKGQAVSGDYRIIKRDGEVRWLHIDRQVEFDAEDGRPIRYYGAAQDITDRKQASDALILLSQELDNKATHLATLYEIAHSISEVSDLNTTLRRVLDKLRSTLTLDAFFVGLYDADTQTMTYPIMYDVGRFWDQRPGILSRAGWVAGVLQTGKPILVNRTADDIVTNQQRRTRLGDVDQVSASILMAPLPIGDQNIGVVSIQSYTLNTYTETHLDLLVAAGYQIAIAVQNARLYDSLNSELAERRRLEAELQNYANQLEQLVAERTNALSQAKQQLELVLNSTVNALAFADPKGNLLVTNPAFKQTFAAADSPSLEVVLLSVVSEEQVAQVSEALLCTIYDGETQRIEAQIIAQDGQPHDVDLTLIPISVDESEHHQGVLLSGHDITQLRQIERFKEQFVADAVHDLATPITGLSTRLYLLKRTPEKLADHIQALENQVQHLRNLLEDLRTLSQMDRGRLELECTFGDLNVLVRRVFDTYEPVAINKEQALVLLPAPELPPVPIDQRQIERVLVNLVSNAINYTPERKTIRIMTRLFDDDGSPFVELAISDQGIGIRPEDQDRIFDRFYRTAEARRNLATGTGLGLAISKEIIEKHGGTITVSSQPGRGSTFTVRLPCQGHISG